MPINTEVGLAKTALDNLKKKVDYIIVGQGIAGSLVAHFLLKAGRSIAIIDDEHSHSSSVVAAGMINPVTGRKYVKSWMIDSLLPLAIITYAEISEIVGLEIYKEVDIVRSLLSIAEENRWHTRMLDPTYTPLMSDDQGIGKYEGHIHTHLGYGVIKGLQVDIPLMLNLLKDYFNSLGILHSFKVNYDDLLITNHKVEYNGIEADQIIFCEGYQLLNNPYFNFLPMEPAKGEALIIKIPDVKFEKILRHRIFIIPLDDDLYWVGAGYAWEFDNDLPTTTEKERLIQELEKILAVPYTIHSHIAGVRPSVRDRRPLIGKHPSYDKCFVFNGLGTKGTSLAPYWAQHFVAHLIEGNPLSDDVNIDRFYVTDSSE